jgi:hypothetical protein
MEANREELREFLEKHSASQELVIQAMEYLQPFLKIASDGPYPLKEASEIDATEMAGALSSAVGKPVSEVRFISVAKAIADSERECGSKERNGLWYALEATLWDALWSRHNVSLWEPLKKSFPGKDRKKSNLGNELWELYSRSLGEPLKQSLQARLSKCGFGYRLCQGLPENLFRAIFYFVGFAVAGNSKKMGRLMPLMSQLPGCIPVGEKRDTDKPIHERNTGTSVWFVLVA